MRRPSRMARATVASISLRQNMTRRPILILGSRPFLAKSRTVPSGMPRSPPTAFASNRGRSSIAIREPRVDLGQIEPDGTGPLVARKTALLRPRVDGPQRHLEVFRDLGARHPTARSPHGDVLVLVLADAEAVGTHAAEGSPVGCGLPVKPNAPPKPPRGGRRFQIASTAPLATPDQPPKRRRPRNAGPSEDGPNKTRTCDLSHVKRAL